MGGAKRMMEEHEERTGGIIGRLEEAGALTRCEIHDYLIDNDDSAAVDDVRQELLEEMDEDDADLLIESALNNAGEECPACAKNRDD